MIQGKYLKVLVNSEYFDPYAEYKFAQYDTYVLAIVTDEQGYESKVTIYADFCCTSE